MRRIDSGNYPVSMQRDLTVSHSFGCKLHPKWRVFLTYVYLFSYFSFETPKIFDKMYERNLGERTTTIFIKSPF